MSEQLEKIKEHLHQIRSVLGLVGDQFTVNRAGDLEVLIDELAERVDKQEIRINNLTFDLAVSRTQNKRYREALEALSDLDHIEKCLDEEVIQVARKALEGDE